MSDPIWQKVSFMLTDFNGPEILLLCVCQNMAFDLSKTGYRLPSQEVAIYHVKSSQTYKHRTTIASENYTLAWGRNVLRSQTPWFPVERFFKKK